MVAGQGSMESTRSKTEVWLIGQHITEITGAQLPSRGDVLRLFFHGHNEHKKTVNDSASEVAASVISFWNKARIPTITEKSIGRKVVDLFLMWKGLKKNCTRTTDTQRKKEETFCDELEDLFDVAHPKAMQLLTIKEDRAFLAAQREKGRRGVMAGVDKKIACSIKRREESKSKQSLQQNQASSALEYDELGSSSETESQSSSSSSTSSLAISPVVSSSNRKRATLKVITPELSSTLDRTGISHRSALRIRLELLEVDNVGQGLRHDTVEEIAASVSEEMTEEQDNECDDEDPSRRPKLSDLKFHLDKALDFVGQLPDLEKHYSTLRDIRADVIKCQHTNLKQGNISDFFKPVSRVPRASRPSSSSEASSVIPSVSGYSSSDTSSSASFPHSISPEVPHVLLSSDSD
ncbi:hypothetical protein Hamer_G000030 [Homarus americanus]|uniref:Uncharacterized protein n=1 Tax=Homarus americanus TaxID=6706 RepID=A0A8J5NC49_HOMAM|nr:hypothetical protein Hamer_G000030 [Homarus americanus]